MAHRDPPTDGAAAAEGPSVAPDLTMVVCTYNRAGELAELLESALAQETGGEFAYEVLVVDNNSSDGTRGVVERVIAAGHPNVRYLLEPRQGKSYALTRALSAVRGRIYTITDDDFLLPPTWLRRVHAAFVGHPEVAFVSGKVLPHWKTTPPAWLTPAHWSAIAMADFGAEEFYADGVNRICLLACAFRLADALEVGGYPGDLAVSGRRIGGTEDADMLMRLWESGKRGIYLPDLVLYHKVEPERTTKRYHRRWHAHHGRSYARMRVAETERASFRIFDVPAHMVRQALADGGRWLGHSIVGAEAAAFEAETRLCFFWGFLRERLVGHDGAGRRART